MKHFNAERHAGAGLIMDDQGMVMHLAGVNLSIGEPSDFEQYEREGSSTNMLIVVSCLGLDMFGQRFALPLALDADQAEELAEALKDLAKYQRGRLNAITPEKWRREDG